MEKRQQSFQCVHNLLIIAMLSACTTRSRTIAQHYVSVREKEKERETGHTSPFVSLERRRKTVVG